MEIGHRKPEIPLKVGVNGCPIEAPWFDGFVRLRPMRSVVHTIALLSGAVVAVCSSVSCDREETARNGQSGTGSSSSVKFSGSGGSGREARNAVEPRRVDPEEVLTKLKETDIGQLDLMAGDIAAMTKANPADALKRVGELSPGSRRDLALRVVVENFPKEMAGELVKWADASPFKEDQSVIGLALPPDGGSLKRDEALQLAREVKSDRVASRLLNYLGYQAASEKEASMTGAKALSQQLPEKMRSEFMSKFISGLSYNRPAFALSEAWANRGELEQSSVEACVKRSAGREPRQALPIINAAIKHEDSYYVIAPFVSGWSQKDPAAAGEWVSGLDGAPKDLAAKELALFYNSKGNYESARKWRDSITDEQIKESVPLP